MLRSHVFKICASISELQLKKMQSRNISSNFTLARLKKKLHKYETYSIFAAL